MRGAGPQGGGAGGGGMGRALRGSGAVFLLWRGAPACRRSGPFFGVGGAGTRASVAWRAPRPFRGGSPGGGRAPAGHRPGTASAGRLAPFLPPRPPQERGRGGRREAGWRRRSFPYTCGSDSRAVGWGSPPSPGGRRRGPAAAGAPGAPGGGGGAASGGAGSGITCDSLLAACSAAIFLRVVFFCFGFFFFPFSSLFLYCPRLSRGGRRFGNVPCGVVKFAERVQLLRILLCCVFTSCFSINVCVRTCSERLGFLKVSEKVQESFTDPLLIFDLNVKTYNSDSCMGSDQRSV